MIPPKTKRFRRGEKHHWWPKSLSQFWMNEEGKVCRLDPSGKVVFSNPKEFGHISNGHNFLYDGHSPWEGTIEHLFDEPDRNMANIIKDLNEFRKWNDFEKKYDYATQEDNDDNLNGLRKCIISLVVRSPMYRDSLDRLVVGLRGELPKKESKMLISSNLGSAYRELVKNSKDRGRLAILFSDDTEFIYGDGIYNNVGVSIYDLNGLQVVIPLTPNIAVVWANPIVCASTPKARALSVDSSTVLMINNAIQIYSKDYLFYRHDKPNIVAAFSSQQHLVFAEHTNSLHEFINDLIKDLSESECLSWL